MSRSLTVSLRSVRLPCGGGGVEERGAPFEGLHISLLTAAFTFYRQSVPGCEKSDFYHLLQKKNLVNFYRFKFNLPNFYRTPTQ